MPNLTQTSSALVRVARVAVSCVLAATLLPASALADEGRGGY